MSVWPGIQQRRAGMRTVPLGCRCSGGAWNSINGRCSWLEHEALPALGPYTRAVIERTGTWSDHSGKGCVLWGDARQTLASIPATQQFDLIFHDAFSPQRCPQLWSEEFLGQLSDRLAPEGRLLTYSRSAAVRASLQRAGLLLRSLLPAPGEREGWSSGTMAVKPPWSRSKQVEGEGWRCFSPLEQAHLLPVRHSFVILLGMPIPPTFSTTRSRTADV